MRRWLAMAAILLALPMQGPAAPALRVHPLAIGIEGAAGEPSLAALRDGVLLTWQARLGAGATALRFARLDDRGRALARGEIARGRGWFVNGADFPAALELADGTWLAYWLQRNGPARYAYEIRLVASPDQGQSWHDQGRLHDDDSATEHGFVAWVPLPGGGAQAVWLDGRDTTGGHAGHGAGTHGRVDAEGGAMTLRGAGVDAAGAAPSVLLDGRVCDCCQTDAAPVADGLLVVYRGRSADEVRDVKLLRQAGGQWQAPEPLFATGWRIAGCPVNGPAIAARGQAVAAAAYDEAEGQGRVQVRTSRDGGRHWQAAVTVARGDSIGRLDLAALPGGRFLLSHYLTIGTRSVLRVELLDRAGRPLAQVDVADMPLASALGFPRLAAVEGGALLAWTGVEDGGPRVHLARIEVGQHGGDAGAAR